METEANSLWVAASTKTPKSGLFGGFVGFTAQFLYLRHRFFQIGSGVKTFHPGHGKAGGSELIEQTRAYLLDFAEAIKSGDAKIVEQRMLAKYPNYHVKQFLTAFSLRAYFPAGEAKATA